MTPLRVYDTDDVPDSFDAREEWPSYIHPIMDQGNCGASWAFSTASVAADRLTIHSMGIYDKQLSAQQILDCDIDYHQKGCRGGHVDRAWWYLRTTGVVTESCYPYKSGFTGLKNKCKLPRSIMRPSATSCPGTAGVKSPVYQVTPPYRIAPHEKEIMKEILQNGPVQEMVSIVIHYQLATNLLIYLSLDNRLCANSWGRDWGEDGYFRILRGTNESEIESFIVGIWAKVNGRELRRHNPKAFLKRRERHQHDRLRLRRKRHSRRRR
ncbi:hypothetical protein LSH36_667g01046 [Paralvinella palmiformis]|uniref:Peptidase C1A papain C-terminal domain-containing protein n=1 Tax=Paralvinella palmiformis TaxID=53620 RepID=A0AAD9MVH3_9ANNE|nr:hypothetical protein LSH36_667g01046 [Paralvinella palmiformis]